MTGGLLSEMEIYTHVKDKAEVDAINLLPGLPKGIAGK